jgi:hypothetical protein
MELESLRDVLQAAIVAGVPLPWTPYQVNEYHSVLSGAVNSGSSLDQTLVDQTSVPEQFRAAVEVGHLGKSADLVLDGLSSKPLVRHQLTQLIRPSMWTLILIFGVSAGLLAAFGQRVAPRIERLRDDVARDVQIPMQSANSTTWIPILVGLFAIAALGLAILVLAGGSHSVASVIGGREYQRCQETAEAIRIADRLIASAVPAEQAVRAACKLLDADPTTTRRVHNLISQGVGGSVEASTFASFAELFELAAVYRLAILRQLLSGLLVGIVGGSATIAYALALFWPIFLLLRDLALPGR